MSCEGQQMLSFEGQQRARRQRVYDGLTFMVDSGNNFEDWDPHHALTNIAQARYCMHASALLLLQSPHKQQAQLCVRCAIATL